MKEESKGFGTIVGYATIIAGLVFALAVNTVSALRGSISADWLGNGGAAMFIMAIGAPVHLSKILATVQKYKSLLTAANKWERETPMLGGK